MAVNTAKRRAKNQAILLSQKKHEPTIDQIDFTTSLSLHKSLANVVKRDSCFFFQE